MLQVRDWQRSPVQMLSKQRFGKFLAIGTDAVGQENDHCIAIVDGWILDSDAEEPIPLTIENIHLSLHDVAKVFRVEVYFPYLFEGEESD